MAKSYLCIPQQQIATEKAINWLCRQAKQKDIARAMGISAQLFTYKKKHNAFTLEDFILALHSVDATLEDLKIMLY